MSFRKTRKDKKVLLNRKKKNYNKNTRKHMGGSVSQDIFDFYQGRYPETDADIKKKILEDIEKIIDKNKDIQVIDSSDEKKEIKILPGSIKNIELLGSWLLPNSSENNTTKKNVKEITAYFYPSLIKSKKDPKHPDKPKLRFGHILIKYNNKYADISSYFQTMFRQTDDALAYMRRGYTHDVNPIPFHKEKITTTELLEDEKIKP